ncbi:MAG: hypothetical protein PHG38_07145, partial [Bacteroidales bacterium]|nr:hypothetical protein [Bacteroidales bacterium]
MDKNTIWAILLIGAILLGFSFFNSKVTKEKQREKFVQDSIAYVEAQKAIEQADKNVSPVSQPDSSSVSGLESPQTGDIYTNSFLNQAGLGSEQFYTLENDKIAVT